MVLTNDDIQEIGNVFSEKLAPIESKLGKIEIEMKSLKSKVNKQITQ